MRFVRLRVLPFGWSIGIFVGAAAFMLWYEWQGTGPIWLIIGCVVLSFFVDAMVHGTTNEKEITIE